MSGAAALTGWSSQMAKGQYSVAFSDFSAQRDYSLLIQQRDYRASLFSQLVSTRSVCPAANGYSATTN
jgi:hypothetical protein